MSISSQLEDLQERISALEEFYAKELNLKKMVEDLTDIGEKLEFCINMEYLPDQEIYHETLDKLVQCTLAVTKILNPDYETPKIDETMEIKQKEKFFGAKPSKTKVV